MRPLMVAWEGAGGQTHSAPSNTTASPSSPPRHAAPAVSAGGDPAPHTATVEFESHRSGGEVGGGSGSRLAIGRGVRATEARREGRPARPGPASPPRCRARPAPAPAPACSLLHSVPDRLSEKRVSRVVPPPRPCSSRSPAVVRIVHVVRRAAATVRRQHAHPQPSHPARVQDVVVPPGRQQQLRRPGPQDDVIAVLRRPRAQGLRRAVRPQALPVRSPVRR